MLKQNCADKKIGFINNISDSKIRATNKAPSSVAYRAWLVTGFFTTILSV